MTCSEVNAGGSGLCLGNVECVGSIPDNPACWRCFIQSGDMSPGWIQG